MQTYQQFEKSLCSLSSSLDEFIRFYGTLCRYHNLSISISQGKVVESFVHRVLRIFLIYVSNRKRPCLPSIVGYSPIRVDTRSSRIYESKLLLPTHDKEIENRDSPPKDISTDKQTIARIVSSAVVAHADESKSLSSLIELQKYSNHRAVFDILLPFSILLNSVFDFSVLF